MAFDLGFDYRFTLAYVTDPSYGVFVAGDGSHNYPHTFTNVDGYSINAGWTATPSDYNNISTSVDVRLAGYNQASSTVTKTFQVDLSSGSAPGAGTYDVDLAVGRENFQGGASAKVIDDTTDKITIAATNTASGEFFDSTGTVRTPGTGSWDDVNTLSSVTFATATCYFQITGENTRNAYAAHFRLTLGGGAAAVRFEHIAHGIGRGILIGR